MTDEKQDTPLTDAEEARDILASRLIDAWCADKGRKIPWAKAIQIVAIVTKQSDEERDRLLRMGDDDGSCEMCGRSAIDLERKFAAAEQAHADCKKMLEGEHDAHMECHARADAAESALQQERKENERLREELAASG